GVHGVLRHHLPAPLRGVAGRQALGRGALLQPREHPDLPRAPAADGHRPSHRLAPGVGREPQAELCEADRRRIPRRGDLANGRSLGVLHPAKKFYPQEQTPIAGVDYRLGLVEDLYLVLGDYAKDGSHATIKIQVNRMVSWLWIGGLVLTLGAGLAILPDQRR